MVASSARSSERELVHENRLNSLRPLVYLRQADDPRTKTYFGIDLDKGVAMLSMNVKNFETTILIRHSSIDAPTKSTTAS